MTNATPDSPMAGTVDTPQTSETVDIFPNGDVILIFEKPSEMRLRVHSKFLRAASEVFRAMLGPDWKEGQGLSEDDPTEVILQDDDGPTLKIICQVLHYRNDAVSAAIEVPTILQIAVAVDKYALNVAMQHAMAAWMQSVDLEKGCAKGCRVANGMHLLAAAYIIGDARLFQKFSKDVILHNCKSFLTFRETELLRESLPDHIYLQLEQKRTAARVELMEDLHLWGMTERGCPEHTCNDVCQEVRAAADPSVAFEDSVSYFAQRVTAIARMLLALSFIDDHVVMRGGEENDDGFVITVASTAQAIGLCLDCARKGTVECRHRS